MVSATTLASTLSIIDAAASTLTSDKTANMVNRVAGVGARAVKAGSSIMSVASQTTILSRMFVDESLLGEPVLPNITKSLHEFYAAQIISAMQLSQMVDSFRTVQDVMSVVQTGHNQREQGIIGNIAARRIGQEAFLQSYHGVEIDSIGLEHYGLEALAYGEHGPMTRAEYKNQESASKKEFDESRHIAKINYNQAAIKSVKGSENRIGPMGELFEVTLSNPNGNGQSIKVPIFIQMQPSIIPQDIAPRFIDRNVPTSTWQRWTMMRAGELTFWRDFVMHRDQIKRQKALLKDPTAAAAFSDYLRTIAKKDKYALDDVTDKLSSNQSSNLANSVMILSEDTVNQAKLDSGINLHDPRDRQRYFANTYTMILVIIDPLHQRVTMYFNGLDGDINSSYTDFRPKDSHFDPKEFMTAMKAFSTNNIGRMR